MSLDEDLDPTEDELDEAGLAELATGFALGELDEADLRRLYDLLCQPEHAARVARITWQALGVTVDLRASLGSRLQDAARLRIDEIDEPERERSFLGGVFSRMGLERPRLRPVQIPLLERLRRRALLPWALLGLGVVGGLVLAFLVLGDSDRLASVTGVGGAATVDGAYLHPGDGLDRRPVLLAAGARLELRWDHADGATSVVVVGPARLVPQSGGLSLNSGRAWISAAAPFTLGLPDAQARVAADSAVAVEVVGETSMLAVRLGGLELRDGDILGTRLAAGEACVSGLSTFPWITAARWHGDDDTRRELEAPSRAPAWQLAFRVSFGSAIDELRLEADAGTALGFVPGELRIGSGAERRVYQLPGAPLRDQHVRIVAVPKRGVHLRITGHDELISLDSEAIPRHFGFSGHAAISEVSFHTGPAPAPPELMP